MMSPPHRTKLPISLFAGGSSLHRISSRPKLFEDCNSQQCFSFVHSSGFHWSKGFVASSYRSEGMEIFVTCPKYREYLTVLSTEIFREMRSLDYPTNKSEPRVYTQS